MKRPPGWIMLLVLACLALPAHRTDAGNDETTADDEPSLAATPVRGVGGAAAALTAAERLPVYLPPRRGAPREKVGSGPGRSAPALATLLALAPSHVAHTVSASPSLFWHIDGSISQGQRLVFTLLAATRTQPILELRLPAPTSPGIQRLRLGEYDVQLEPGVEYEWSVALVVEAQPGEIERLDSGFVQRVDPPVRLRGARSVHAYAQLGLWYDALEMAIDAAAEEPERRDLREQRDSLLRQAGLEAAIRRPTPVRVRAP